MSRRAFTLRPSVVVVAAAAAGVVVVVVVAAAAAAAAAKISGCSSKRLMSQTRLLSSRLVKTHSTFSLDWPSGNYQYISALDNALAKTVVLGP